MSIVETQKIVEAYENVQKKGEVLQYVSRIADFFENNGVEVYPLPAIKFSEKDDGALTATGHYDSEGPTMTLYIGNRHIKDILRSFAHELYHHHQFLVNKDGFRTMDDSGKVEDNDNLEKCERDAYENGNILFRKWTESING